MYGARFELQDGQWSRTTELMPDSHGWTPEQDQRREDRELEEAIDRVDDLLDEIAAKHHRVMLSPEDEMVNRWDDLEDELDTVNRGPHLVYKRDDSF